MSRTKQIWYHTIALFVDHKLSWHVQGIRRALGIKKATRLEKQNDAPIIGVTLFVMGVMVFLMVFGGR